MDPSSMALVKKFNFVFSTTMCEALAIFFLTNKSLQSRQTTTKTTPKNYCQDQLTSEASDERMMAGS